MDDKARCAQLLGMKRAEIVAVVLDDDGLLAQTHDGVWTLVRPDGSLVHRAAAPGGVVTGGPAVVGERGPEEVVMQRAVKRRGRS